MPMILYKFFPKEENDKSYSSHEEYFLDLAKKIEMLFAYYIEISENKKSYIQRKTARHIKEQGRDRDKVFQRQKQMCISDYRDAENIIDMKKNVFKKGLKNIPFIAFDYVCEFFNFTQLEKFCFTVAFIMKNYKDFYLFLPNLSAFVDVHFDYDMIIDLFDFISDEEELNPIERKKSLVSKMSLLVFDDKNNWDEDIKLNEAINRFVITNGESYGNNQYMEIYYPPNRSMPLLVMDDIAQNIYAFSELVSNKKALFYYISGKKTMGKRTQVKRFAQIKEQIIVFVDLNSMLLKNLENNIITACRVALLNHAAVCVTNLQVLQVNLDDEEDKNEDIEKLKRLLMMIDKLGIYMDTVFLLSEYKKYNPLIKDGRMWMDVQMRMPTIDESIKLWNQGILGISLENRIRGKELANKFMYTPGQIHNAVYEAKKLNIWKKNQPLTQREFYSCIYKQVSHSLEKKAELIYAKHDWNKLILPSKEKKMLRDACNQIKNKNTVYEKWGMNERITYGRGISMLFAGPPGTGKTMGAHVIANELGIEMYKVNLSQVVSKYIGETEKNLNEIFKEAQKTSVILFFDETDAILGKRTEVKDAHDKNANVETSFLLQKMEEYDGITVMTTNYIENIDNAFFRRISYVIHFPFPDEEYRKKIWMNMFPKQMPIDPDIDFDYLAEQFEIAGGNIKNIVVSAAFMAADEKEPVSMTHIVRALKYEMSKQGKNTLKEDFGEYGFLLEDN